MNENKIVTKPITLIKEEFLQNMVDLCNNSGLPFFVIEYTINDLLKDIHVASQKQHESDRAKYNEELSKLKSQSLHTEVGVENDN